MKLRKTFWCFCLLVVACGLFSAVLTTRSSAAHSSQQIARRDEDLGKVFRKHELLKLDLPTVTQQVKSTGKVSLVSSNKTYDLVLMPNDMRAPNYHAEETAEGGVRRAVESGPVRTYKGFVRGMDGALARFTIDEKSFEGMILGPEATYFVEPVSRYSGAASASDFVIYNEADLLKSATISCDATLNERVNTAVKEMAPRAEAPAALRVIDLATEADAEMVTQFGSVALANAEILSVMNQVDAVYQRDLAMTFSITFQHGWTTADPYSTDPVTCLNNFRDHWNVNFPNTNPQYQRDTAHMWTANTSLFGQGRAKLGVVCLNPTSAYGWSSTFPVAPQKFILPAHEIGHNFNASHVDTVPGCSNTIMIVVSDNNTQLAFCPFSINSEILPFVNANSACLAIRNEKTRFDFGGDAKADLAVFRQAVGFWYIINSANNAFSAQQFGAPGDIPAPEDYDGDGRADFGIFRPSTGSWYLLQTRAGFAGLQFGANGDRPMSGDYDGDGKADIAVFRPTTGAWYILNSSNGSVTGLFFGAQGDIPAPGDFDGDGKFDIAIFRPSTGYWYIQQSRDGFRAQLFGANGDRPDPADFDGDRKADLAIFRQSVGGWYIQQSTAGFRGQSFGGNGDIPIAADYDGDGKADVAVWRPADGGWYILSSINGAFRAEAFGAAGDVPSPGAYVGGP